MPAELQRVLLALSRRSDLVLALIVIVAVLMMIIPLPPLAIDMLIAMNIAASVLITLVAFYVTRPVELSALPAIVLLATLFRLTLTISTTRLILLDGDAGEVVATFGSFVIGGNVAVGLVIFLVITISQFVVITKGAERVAEVAARFSLDALPGKQMAIGVALPLAQQQGDRGVARGPHLRARLGVGEGDAVVVRLDPGLAHRQHFHAPEAGQQHRADRSQRGWVLAFTLHLGHDLAEMADLADAETPLQPVRGDDTDPVRRALLDDAEPAGVIEQAAQRADGAAGDAGTARGLPTAAWALFAGRLASRDIGLQPLDIGELQVADDPGPDQRPDVLVDTAAVAGDGRRLDRAAVPAEQSSGLRLLEIPVADLRDGHAFARRAPFGRGVAAIDHGG